MLTPPLIQALLTMFIAGIVATLAFGGCIAWRFFATRDKLGLAVAIFMILETVALTILFFLLSQGRSAAGETPVLEVQLRPLVLQVFSVGVVGAVLGGCYFVVIRFLAPGNRIRQGAMLAFLLPLSVGTLIFGVWSIQVRPYSPMSLDFEIVPESTQQPKYSDVQLVRAFPNLSFTCIKATASSIQGCQLTNLMQPDDGTNRIFVTEQEGRILVFPNDETVTETSVFLDITGRVSDNDFATNPEEGLLGLAFDPDFRTNGYLYVHFSAPIPRRSVVSRFSVNEEDPNLADPESETILMEIPQPGRLHNGGQLAFGPDGYLYIGVGYGGPQGDPDGHAQNTATVLGSILRIDVGGVSEGRNYRIPPDNPFVDKAEAKEEIWAYGIRQPWRFSFDWTTGMMWASDTGQERYEEINIVEKGANYGWNIMEGRHCFRPPVGCDESGLQAPLVEYSHLDGCAVVGGYVYRGAGSPLFRGAYVYGDYCSGRIWGVRFEGESLTKPQLLVDSDVQITSFGQDLAGDIYVFPACKPKTTCPIHRLFPLQ